jgi:crossover junction endodeoxyribonuclease RusA
VNRNALAAWKNAVQRAAAGAIADAALAGKDVQRPIFKDTPVYVRIIFFLERPQGHYNAKGELKPWAIGMVPAVKPDKDKLERATLDALTGIIFDDDSRVVDGRTTKQYADARGDEGAFIRVKEFVRQVATTPLFAETRAGP